MKAWGKLKIEDRIFKDVIVQNQDFNGVILAICDHFDLSKPVICEKHIKEVASYRITVFYPDDFLEDVTFDALEIEIFANKKKNK
ncbi:MAG: hypothetical protein ACOX8Q_02730 [Christensenellales bacterium]